MNTALATAAPPELPAPDSHWRDWVTYGLSWAAVAPIAQSAPTAVIDRGRFMTVHAYREAEPGPRWRALYDATWPAYRSWYTREGLAARPSLQQCRRALTRYMPELVPTWERLCRLSGDDAVAARMLSMWRLPAFAVGCSQLVMPGGHPTLLRNYDYDQALFEAVIASTDYSGSRRVLGTSDMLWGLLDGMNSDGLAVSLTFGGRPDVGDGFGIPIVLRYVLETCASVRQAVSALRRIPVSQSYNVALVDGAGDHATVFVTPGEPAEVSALHATTNHRLDRVEHPSHAARLDSVGRQSRLNELRTGATSQRQLVAAMLAPPIRNDQFEIGFGTLYTAEYRPTAGTATWHWPEESWTRGFDDPDDICEVRLA
jgi:predicted choloylglycine hydrolase